MDEFWEIPTFRVDQNERRKGKRATIVEGPEESPLGEGGWKPDAPDPPRPHTRRQGGGVSHPPVRRVLGPMDPHRTLVLPQVLLGSEVNCVGLFVWTKTDPNGPHSHP